MFGSLKRMFSIDKVLPTTKCNPYLGGLIFDIPQKKKSMIDIMNEPLGEK